MQIPPVFVVLLERLQKIRKYSSFGVFWSEANAISAFTAPELSHIRSVSLTFVVSGNMNVKELVAFLYFVFKDSIIHLPFFFFLNDPLAISHQLPGKDKQSHNTAR